MGQSGIARLVIFSVSDEDCKIKQNSQNVLLFLFLFPTLHFGDLFLFLFLPPGLDFEKQSR